MNQRGLIGVFVLAAFVLLGWLVLLFGRNPTLFRGAGHQYYVVFDYAPGVTANTPVRRSGVRIGQVEKVQLDDATGKVRVTIVIDAPHLLYDDDRPRLLHGALSGDTSIDFEPPAGTPIPKAPAHGRGQESGIIKPVAFLLAQQQGNPPADLAPPERKPAAPGTTFQGVSQSDVSSLLSELGKLTPPARAAFIEMQRTLDRVEKMTPLFEETMREVRDLAKATRDTMPELREFVKSTRETMPEIRKTAEEAQVTARNWARVGERVDVLLQTNEDRLTQAVNGFNDAVRRVATLLGDENQRNVTTILRNAGAASKNFDSISRNTDELLKESQKTMRRFGDSVTQADEILGNLKKATRPIAERSESVMKNLDEGTGRLNSTLMELNSLLSAVNKEDSALRRFISDPALYNNLSDATATFAHSMPRVDRILRDFEVFADKIARHPEALGVGGVVRPSAGLKDPPSTSHLRGP
jgi:phospholipid/cholesterol/gamma-HCH transport system substrate-binding protein